MVHYRDTDSTWAEIDRNFKMSPLPGYDFSVTEGLFRIHAKADLSQEHSLVFETADSLRLYTKMWGVAYLDISTKNYKILQRTQPTTAEASGNEIIYRNAFSDVDIHYYYEDTKLKEEVHLTQAARDRLPRPAKYGFQLKNTYLVFITKLGIDKDKIRYYASNADITESDYETEGRIDFKSLKNELKYFFPVDYAYMPSTSDSGMAVYEHKVRKRIIRKNGNRYLLAGVPLSWLKDLPKGTVIIDPTVQYGLTAVEDVWLENSSNKNNYTFLCIAKDRTYPKKRALLKFDMGENIIPSTAQVDDARLKVYYAGYSGNSSSYPWVDRPVRVYRG